MIGLGGKALPASPVGRIFRGERVPPPFSRPATALVFAGVSRADITNPRASGTVGRGDDVDHHVRSRSGRSAPRRPSCIRRRPRARRAGRMPLPPRAPSRRLEGDLLERPRRPPAPLSSSQTKLLERRDPAPTSATAAALLRDRVHRAPAPCSLAPLRCRGAQEPDERRDGTRLDRHLVGFVEGKIVQCHHRRLLGAVAAEAHELDEWCDGARLRGRHPVGVILAGELRQRPARASVTAASPAPVPPRALGGAARP